MLAKNKRPRRQIDLLLNEHWKRKRRLRPMESRVEAQERRTTAMSNSIESAEDSFYVNSHRVRIDDLPNQHQDRICWQDHRAPVGEPSLPAPDIHPNGGSTDAQIPVGNESHRSLATHRAQALARLASLIVLIHLAATCCCCLLLVGATQIHSSDPRPTIYSGQVSFGLLLSAHSSLGSELSTAASTLELATTVAATESEDTSQSSVVISRLELSATTGPRNETIEADASRVTPIYKRQIFERTGNKYSRQQSQQQPAPRSKSGSGGAANGSSGGNDPAAATCGLVNSNSLYAGMGAIWASHQANLVGDSHLAIGTYVYDSCNDLDIGQRQAVRIVSNLNAFQQTTCEAPRGSPISLTIAHGDNQLRAIQLLTSFKVPVITTKEHFALEDYNQLSRDQRKFLFSTAPSSRHLAMGSLRFSKRIVSRQSSSPKLLNQFYKMSSRNGLIVISRNLPARFITYLTEIIPNHVNYEISQSSQPIDQIKSVDALESLLIRSNQQASTSGSASSSLVGESRIESTVVPPPTPIDAQDPRLPMLEREGAMSSDSIASRSDSGDDSATQDGTSTGDFDSPGEGEQPKMLSPTILMFITPSEAIDLVTRLRNDLAEVSRYYSLIVSTREDISPALRTIFHRGGSRLCSGKAFYTISPKPDDISEFSRYFRDTVQMEGETSDHPLICEFAKYQSTSKLSADLDDVSTEPVIKAVWAAAAAFKSVYRRECATLASTDSSSGSTPSSRLISSRQSTSGGTSSSSGQTGGKQQSHPDCMVKMNKVMSSLVQRALKRMDVTINSTGLQAFDGFRIKFDDLNELMTNKFSIKYINKECEITEVGQFSGFKDSSLKIDDDVLMKSLESALPDPWPPSPPPTPPAPPAQTTTSSTSTSASSPSSKNPTGDSDSSFKESTSADGLGGGDGNSLSSGSDGADGLDGDQSVSGRRRQKSVRDRDDSRTKSANDSVEDDSSVAANDGKEDPIDSSQRTRKRSRNFVNDSDESRLDHRNNKQSPKGKIISLTRQVVGPVTAMGSKGLVSGLSDALEDSTTALGSAPTQKPMRKLKPFPTTIGVTLKDWVPTTKLEPAPQPSKETLAPPMSSLSNSAPIVSTTSNPRSMGNPGQSQDNEQMDPGNQGQIGMKTSATTQAPIYTTLPESDGNADLEPTKKADGSRVKRLDGTSVNSTLDTAASNSMTTESSEYVTSPSIMQNSYNQKRANHIDSRSRPPDGPHTPEQPVDEASVKFNYFRDLNSSPVPLSATSGAISTDANLGYRSTSSHISDRLHLPEGGQIQSDPSKAGRSKIRAQLRWIYSSWFALSILASNICGALLTLYVLTFLLMKNCDGSLDRDNQGIRSMHLLSIIVVFFGSTLFIIYPTPGLCLLRTSWHNFALVLLFGSLLLQTMQTRSMNSIGLGGRPNRLNQFLTLVFMVGVQVSFEIQKWKYESLSYVNFVNQYFNSNEGDDKKLVVLSGSLANQFNPMNSFNDQVTPVSIQVSERYQSLLQDYCSQRADDFVQSQIYLFAIVVLLLIFSVTTRKSKRNMQGMGVNNQQTHRKLAATLMGADGKLMAHQHEANIELNPNNHFKFSSNVINARANANNLFVVSLIISSIYFMSIFLHTQGQSYVSSHDLISSVTMVSIAFITLVGIFMPILRQVHRYEDMLSDPITGSISRTVITQSKSHDHNDSNSSPNSASAFAMFPEFAQTGHRRPSSMSEDSSSGAGSRRPFAETKESRRNMGAVLANLRPTTDSLRNMGLYGSDSERTKRITDYGCGNSNSQSRPIDPALLNLKLNISSNGDLSPIADDLYKINQQLDEQSARRRDSRSEKRLIMLDVDPCCPRHGIVASKHESHGSRCSNPPR